MRNSASWAASKFVLRKSHWVPSSRTSDLLPASRLAAAWTIKFYEEEIPNRAHGVVADLGCGRVPLFGLYRGVAERVLCVDWSESLHGNEHLDLAADLNQSIPLKSREVDCVILSDVLEHIAEPAKVMSEAHRILKPGGTVLLNTPFFYWIHEAPFDFGRYTEFGLKHLAVEAGFVVEEIYRLGGSLTVQGDLILKHLWHGGPIGRILVRALNPLANFIIFSGLGLRVERFSSRRLPFGYGMILTKP